jgi:hypothetical protein
MPRTRLARHDLVRVARRRAAGWGARAIAESVGASEALVTALLAEPRVRRLVAACRELRGRPDAARLRRLRELAWMVLEDALDRGDPRVAAYIVWQGHRGRHVVDVLVLAALRAAAARAEVRAGRARPRTRAGRPPVHPVERALRRTEADLRWSLIAQHAQLRRDARAAARPAPPVTPVAAPVPAPRAAPRRAGPPLDG